MVVFLPRSRESLIRQSKIVMAGGRYWVAPQRPRCRNPRAASNRWAANRPMTAGSPLLRGCRGHANRPARYHRAVRAFCISVCSAADHAKRHSRESGKPVLRSDSSVYWVPAFAGMTPVREAARCHRNAEYSKQAFLGCPTNACSDSLVVAAFFSKAGRPSPLSRGPGFWKLCLAPDHRRGAVISAAFRAHLCRGKEEGGGRHAAPPLG